MTNLAVNLAEVANATPDAVALTVNDDHMTYSELEDSVARCAGFLVGQGLEPGDRVGLMMPNIPAFAIIYYGVLRAGGIVVPMNPLQSGREVLFFLQNTAAGLLFAHKDCESAASEGAEGAGATSWIIDDTGLADLIADSPAKDMTDRADSDTAIILHTSGTTGKPKGAELTHANLNQNQAVTVHQMLSLEAKDVVLGCLPLFHAFGMTCSLNSSIAAGATLVLLPRFDPDKALDLIEGHHVTTFLGVPTMYSALLHAEGRERDTSSLQTCISGGAAMPLEVLRSFEERYDCVILEGYGLSESSPVACFNLPDRERRVGSIGMPVEGVEMRIVGADRQPLGPDEPGEVEIRGHNVMKGYWRLPDTTAETIKDGWLATGDIGRTDADGYFYIVDRIKSLIIRGGYNVYPREVEEVIYEHPAVAEAAVVGIPDDVLGEEVGAAVALKRDASATEDELQSFVKERVAAYKYPRKVWIVDTLPKGATGKILRREITIPDAAEARE